MGASEELVEVIDERGRVLRLATRAAVRAGNLRHRTVAVVVVTSGRELVAHRRAHWKDVWPGRWDVCFGGLAGVGEAGADAAARELAEEAGITVAPADLRPLGSGGYADAEVSCVACVYLASHDGPFTPADGEVAELVRVPLAGLDGWLAGRSLCPDSAAVVVPLVRALVVG